MPDCQVINLTNNPFCFLSFLWCQIKVAPFAPDLVAHYHRIGGTISPDWWHYIVRISHDTGLIRRVMLKVYAKHWNQ
jgi:hypothetical protein